MPKGEKQPRSLRSRGLASLLGKARRSLLFVRPSLATLHIHTRELNSSFAPPKVALLLRWPTRFLEFRWALLNSCPNRTCTQMESLPFHTRTRYVYFSSQIIVAFVSFRIVVISHHLSEKNKTTIVKGRLSGSPFVTWCMTNTSCKKIASKYAKIEQLIHSQ